MVLLFKGVLIVIIIKLLSDYLNLTTIGLLLEYVIEWGPLALIIIFQPEIRNILEHLGRKQLLGRFNYEFACLITPRVPRIYHKKNDR